MSALVVALPMYNRPELHAAFDALWAGTRDCLRAAGVADVPQAPTPLEAGLKDFWQRPDLLRSQTCGMPYRHLLKDGIARGSFEAVDPLGMQHLFFGPIITLSLSREMTARFPERDALYPMERTRASYIDLILRLLVRTTA